MVLRWKQVVWIWNQRVSEENSFTRFGLGQPSLKSLHIAYHLEKYRNVRSPEKKSLRPVLQGREEY